MKRLVLLTMIFGLAIAGVKQARAVEFKHGQDITIPKGQLIDDDLFVACKKIVIEGTVKGDVFAFASEIEVRGRIEGELFAFAGKVSLKDTITGPARIFAGEISQTGYVGGNFMAFGGKVSMPGTLGRDALIKCGKAVITGAVGRDLGIEGDRIAVSGAVGRDAYLRAKKDLDLGPALAIGRDLSYKTLAKMDLPQGIMVAGQSKWTRMPVEREHGARHGGFNGFKLFFRWMAFLSALVAGLILIALTRKQSLAIASEMRGNFWKSLGLGALWIIAVPLCGLIVALTIIGLPLALFSGFCYFVLLYLSIIYFSLMLGKLIFDALKKPETSPYGAFLLGLVLVNIVFLIPFLGGLVKLFAMATGGGAALFVFARSLRQAKTNGSI
jgi:hypothetical protein